MKPNLILSLACTFTVFAVGAGFQRLTVASPIPLAAIEAPAESAPVAAPRTANLPVLPTVYVVADADSVDAPELTGVMAAPVGHARKALASRLGKSARWVGMNVPYYAFAGLASRSSE